MWGMVMSRNYGWGSRDMTDAARIALQVSGASYSTIYAITTRFKQFQKFAKIKGVGRLERITPRLVAEYGMRVADKVNTGEIEPATAHNLIASINAVMRAVRCGYWRNVSPTKDCGISPKSCTRKKPTIKRELAASAIKSLTKRQQAIAMLALYLGLQSKEAALLDAKKALKQVLTKGRFTIEYGTKGGRKGRKKREVVIRSESQMKTLEKAAFIQDKDRNMIPEEKSYKDFRAEYIREIGEVVGAGMEELRASYVTHIYEGITGHAAPCNNGTIKIKDKDREARKVIAKELGYRKVDSVRVYIGSSRV